MTWYFSDHFFHHFYCLQQKLQECNVFTGVCLFVIRKEGVDMAGPRSLPLSLVPCPFFGWVCLVQGPFEGGLGMPGLRSLLGGVFQGKGWVWVYPGRGAWVYPGGGYVQRGDVEVIMSRGGICIPSTPPTTPPDIGTQYWHLVAAPTTRTVGKRVVRILL